MTKLTGKDFYILQSLLTKKDDKFSEKELNTVAEKLWKIKLEQDKMNVHLQAAKQLERKKQKGNL